MNGRIAKKIRKNTKHNAKMYLMSFKSWPFWNRIGLAWWLVFGDKRKV